MGQAAGGAALGESLVRLAYDTLSHSHSLIDRLLSTCHIYDNSQYTRNARLGVTWRPMQPRLLRCEQAYTAMLPPGLKHRHRSAREGIGLLRCSVIGSRIARQARPHLPYQRARCLAPFPVRLPSCVCKAHMDMQHRAVCTPWMD